MSEGQPPPNLSRIPEIYPQTNHYYQAVTENQMLWREATHSSIRSYEMPRLSYTIEGKMKKVFSDYIAPSYPRLLIAWSFLLDTPSHTLPYYRLIARYPEHIRQEDRQDYAAGMYHLNEWATNYATRHYIETASTNPITQPMRKAYAAYGDTIVGRVNTLYTYRAMREAKRAASASGVNFDHAVFTALFQHDFTALNGLIAATPTLEAANHDELALVVGHHSAKTFDPTKEIFRHFSPKPTDSTIMKTLKNTADSLLTGGQFAQPGIVEVVVAAPIGLSTIGALEGTISGDVKGMATSAAIASSIATVTYPFVLIHESVHGYSANAEYIGLLPRQIVQEGGNGQ